MTELTDEQIMDALDSGNTRIASRVWNMAIEAATKLALEYDERYSSKSLVEEIRELKK